MCKSLKYGKRLLALLLVVVMVSGSTYRARAAAVLPEVVVSGGEALAYLLGILGLTAGGSYVIDNKDDLISWGDTQIGKLKTWTKENSDKVNTWGAATSQEIETAIDTWIDKAAKGVIDTGSAVWDSLKAWGGSIYDKLHAGDALGTWGYAIQVPATGKNCGHVFTTTSIYVNYKTMSYIYNASTPVYAVHNGKYDYLISPQATTCTRYVYRDSDLFATQSITLSSSTVVDGTTVYYWCQQLSAGDKETDDLLGMNNLSLPGTQDQVVANIINGMSIAIPEDEYISVGGVSDIFDRDKTLDNIGVLVPGITAGATDIPIDWGLVGDIAGTLTDVRAGTLDIADVLADAKVFPIDKTRDTVIDSDGDLSNDKAKDDVIPAVPDAALSDYTLAGLEKVFPFCIPFDLMSFLGVLAADPEAPVFDWPITYPTLSGSATYTLHIDLSDFDPVAKIVRDMECLGFIMGLIMITRDKMIMG